MTQHKYIEHGLLGTNRTKHITTKVGEDDMDFLREVFDEPGVQTNLPGALLARFSDFLRSQNVVDAQTRRASPHNCVLTLAVDNFANQQRHDSTI